MFDAVKKIKRLINRVWKRLPSLLRAFWGRGAFKIAGILMCNNERAKKFMQAFLQGQGMNGCVETTFQSHRRRFRI